jgi:hypothetical protein
MKSGIFTIDIFKDLDYEGRKSLAKCTSNPEILILLSEVGGEYVKGEVVQNINTPIYILTKMLEEYDDQPWGLKTEDHYSGYRKENIEKTLRMIEKNLGEEQFRKTKRVEEILYTEKYFF